MSTQAGLSLTFSVIPKTGFLDTRVGSNSLFDTITLLLQKTIMVALHTPGPEIINTAIAKINGILLRHITSVHR